MSIPGPRGHYADHLAVRMADEGMPVAAIARVVKRPSHELWPVLKEAVQVGALTQLPSADWPPGQSRDLRVPALRRTAATEANDLILPLMLAFRLSGQEAAMLAYLLAHGTGAKARLHQAIYPAGREPETDPKIVDVVVCKLRKKLGPLGFDIETVWGSGYVVPSRTRDAILAYMTEANA